jgi:NAD-dependent DNA ligase
MTSHVARRAISSCLALRGDGNAALAGSFRARAAPGARFHRRAVSRAPTPRHARTVKLAAGESLPSGARAESVPSSDSWREDAARWASSLDANAAKEEAETLAVLIAKHDSLYYLDCDPEISDAAYDRLRVRLEALEEAHPEVRRRDSPTKRVGAPASSSNSKADKDGNVSTEIAGERLPSLARVSHVAPMRSLTNVFSNQEALLWERKLRRALGGEWFDEEKEPRKPATENSFRETSVAFVAEPKIDGASVSVTYVDGRLARCVSRGDGLVGEDVTKQLAGCLGIPETLRTSTSEKEGFTTEKSPGTWKCAARRTSPTPISQKSTNDGSKRAWFRSRTRGTRSRARCGAWTLLWATARTRGRYGSRRTPGAPCSRIRNVSTTTSLVVSRQVKNGDSFADDDAFAFWRSQREFKAFAAQLGFDPVPTLAEGDGVDAVLRAHETLAREREELAILLADRVSDDDVDEDAVVVSAPKNDKNKNENEKEKAGYLEDQKKVSSRSFGYAVDGVVYKVDDASLQRALGSDARAPRWATAHKFQAAAAVTTLASIDVQVGRTGALTPVAILNPPAELGGASVRRATLHNFSDLERKNLHRAVGRRVLVERAGDVIPRVVGVADDFFDAEGTEDEEDKRAVFTYRPPKECPSCGAAVRASPLLSKGNGVTQNAAVLRCTGGLRCPAQATERIAHFVSRDALDVPGLAKAQIAAFCDERVVTSPADLFTLRARFASFETKGGGIGGDDDETETSLVVPPKRWLYVSGKNKGTLKASFLKLFDALDEVASRGVPLSRFLFALGIRGVGRETANALARRFVTLDAFREAARREAETLVARELSSTETRRVSNEDEAKDEAKDEDSATHEDRSLLTSIEGVGPAVAFTIGEFFAEPANVAALDALLASGVRVLPHDDGDERDDEKVVDARAFAGLRVVVTGTVPGMTRAEALRAVTDAGGIAQSAVSGKTDVLVSGDGAGRRKAEAASLRGALVIDARAFLDKLFPESRDE